MYIDDDVVFCYGDYYDFDVVVDAFVCGDDHYLYKNRSNIDDNNIERRLIYF